MKCAQRIIFALVISLCSLQLQAQDIHFSQYYFSPLSLNPANCGNYNGDFRGFANYRSQWKEIDKAYKTISAGGDYSFYPMNQKVTGGVYFVNDRSGINLVVNKIFVTGAVAKNIRGFDMHLGIQPGFVMKNIDLEAHTYPNQLNWGTGYYDAALPNQENSSQPNTKYFDLNAGFVISKRINKIEAEIGFAGFHLNSPKETLISSQNKLKSRKIYHLELRYFLNEKITIKPHGMLNATTKASDLLTGVNVDYMLSKTPFFRNSVFAGFMWRDGFRRISDAAIFTVGMNYLNYTFGVSYDVNISELHTATNYKGAIEFAIIYTGKNTRLIKKEVPCERL
jgi:type IX secretion system PorP/SprF family membrane protein